VERIGRAFEGVASQSRRMSLNRTTSRRRTSSRRRTTSRRMTSRRTTSRRVMSLNRITSRRRTTSHRTTSRRTNSRTLFSQTTGTNCGFEPKNPFFFVSRRSPHTCTSQKGFSTQKCRERVLLHIIEILRLSDLIYPKGNQSQDVVAHN